jgi:3-deoxy-manno-octulosonate cytidylyltransferase (CMP-KDO synthetase)
MKTIGIVPARMTASRFPGKPLHSIAGRPMLEHCFLRARLFGGWDGLFVATCDNEIRAFCEDKGFPVVMTADSHSRALDRVAEAMEICGVIDGDDDIVVCVQADEPLLGPDMLEAVIAPFAEDERIEGTLLAVPITEKAPWLNPDIVKIAHDLKGDVLYTSRSPIPYAKAFPPAGGAKRVGGIFGFRRHFLRWFSKLPESPLEQAEACDSNRICDNGRRQRIAQASQRPYVSVDSPSDVKLVEAALPGDPYWGTY